MPLVPRVPIGPYRMIQYCLEYLLHLAWKGRNTYYKIYSSIHYSSRIHNMNESQNTYTLYSRIYLKLIYISLLLYLLLLL
uniref:Uncharacterized protein n=1 Tax=Mus spicilegus TaxID=10103 RepID=A0A8C6GY16_MUSSI